MIIVGIIFVGMWMISDYKFSAMSFSCLYFPLLLQQFEATYTEELRLNVAFNNYVQAFEQAYNGPNTIQHQVGVSKLATSSDRKLFVYQVCHNFTDEFSNDLFEYNMIIVVL